MKSHSPLRILALVAIASGGLMFLNSCEKNPPDGSTDTFDKAAMLSNIGKNIVLHAYQDFSLKIDSLESAFVVFKNNLDSSNLSKLQATTKDAYLAYQLISSFDFGPAEDANFRVNANTFPCDTSQIISKIYSADYTLGSVGDIDAKGFPALDFLLFHGSNLDVIYRFKNHPKSILFLKYLETVLTEIQNKAKGIDSKWNTAYMNQFTSSTGSSIGSSIGMLANQLCLDLEILKNAKIGIPAGKKSMGTLFLDKSEGYYSGISKDLLSTNLRQLKSVFTGNSSIGNGIGFDDYLIHLNVAHNQVPLNEEITNQFDSCLQAIAFLPQSIPNAIVNTPEKVDKLYNSLQQLIVLLKVDMTSALGIQITYQDNDGD